MADIALVPCAVIDLFSQFELYWGPAVKPAASLSCVPRGFYLTGASLMVDASPKWQKERGKFRKAHYGLLDSVNAV
jgi:hypothetical protein